MTQLVVAVRDQAMEAFARPFVVPTASWAIRNFQDEVNRQAADNPMYNHPADYELWALASYNEKTGEFINEPRRLAKASDLKAE